MSSWSDAGYGEAAVLRGSLDRATARCSRGNVTLEEQVRRFFEEFREPIFRYLLSSGATGAEADDVAQETFLRLYRHLHGGHSIDNVRAWVFRVAQNLWIDTCRTGKHLMRPSEASWEQAQELRADPSLNPEELVLRAERVHQLQRAIAELTSKQRQSLHLRAEGLSYREIAMIMDVNISTVVDAVRRAVEKIGKVWHE